MIRQIDVYLLVAILWAAILFPYSLRGINVVSLVLLIALCRLAVIWISKGGPRDGLVVYLVLVFLPLPSLVFAERVDTDYLRGYYVNIFTSYAFFHIVRNKSSLRKLASYTLPVLLFSASLGILQTVTGESIIVSSLYGDYYGKSGVVGDATLKVAHGFSYNPLIQGMIILAAYHICLHRIISSRRNSGVWKIVILMLLISAICTGNRTTIVALILSSTVSLIFFKFYRELMYIFGLSLIAFTTIMFGLLNFNELFSSSSTLYSGFFDRYYPVASMLGYAEPTIGNGYARYEIYMDALDIAQDNILGVGLGNFHIYSRYGEDTHSLYLSILLEMGLQGLIIFSAILFYPLFRIKKDLFRRTDLVVVCVVATFFSYSLVGLFWHVELNKFYWIIFGIYYSLIHKNWAETEVRGCCRVD